MFMFHFSRHISKGALERSLSTNLCPHVLSPGPFDIVTLDPKKFAEKEQKRFDFSNLNTFTPRISLLKNNRNRKQLSPLQLFYDKVLKSPRNTLPFPPDTKAFLYYTTPPEKPRIAGELRLRVTSSDNPGSFESGSDLLLSNGQPWFRPLYTLSKYFFPMYEKLREDQLIPDDLDAVLSTFPSKRLQFRRSHFLFTLNDTFVVNFSGVGLRFFIITEQGVDSLLFRNVFSERRVSLDLERPYTGSALARFERSTLPEHEGTRTIVLRFLKIITPVKCVIPLYDGYISCPKEGELHRRRPYISTRIPKVWSTNIDGKEIKGTRCFQLLWDT